MDAYEYRKQLADLRTTYLTANQLFQPKDIVRFKDFNLFTRELYAAITPIFKGHFFRELTEADNKLRVTNVTVYPTGIISYELVNQVSGQDIKSLALVQGRLDACQDDIELCE